MNFTRSKFFVSILLLLFCISAKAQEQKAHEKKVYVSEDSSIYWQGDLPVYIFLSTDPEGKNPIRLNKGNADQYTNPYYFDTEGKNFIRTRWAVDRKTKKAIVPALEVELEVENDRIAPTTAIDLKNAPKFVGKGTVYYGKGLEASLDAKDALSGVEGIHLSQNKGAYASYDSPIKVEREGEHTFTYYSVDNVGNIEEPNSKIFTLDITPPQTKHAIVGDHLDNIISPKAKLELTSHDALSGVKSTKYKFDEGDNKGYYSKISLASLTEGDHTIKYFSEDEVKNAEAEKSYSFYLDKTAPIAHVEFEGARHKIGTKTFVAGPTKIRIVSTDNKAGVEKVMYSFDGVTYEEYKEPFNLVQGQSKKSIKYYAVDKVKNKSTARADNEVGSLYLDLTAPKLSYSYSGEHFLTRDTMFITSETNIVLKATDYEAGVKEITTSVDKGTETVYDGTLNIEGSGFHTIDYIGKDQVMNTRKESFFVMVDNDGPEIFYHLSMDAIGEQMLKDKTKPIPVYASHTKLYLAATDVLVGTDKIYYTIDGGTEKLYTGPIQTSKAGLRALSVRAVDKLGNEKTSELIEFVIQ
ncbi:hypothetical protein R9C00_06655 [Flammeovirgaceae bacterium SG7u.111]|nr:hypothetical protein [Flammeovirgaceae bacterium SG7u.132]WPO37122.1 hypothetical protein R9C00_06655 [Flammeovirgaceae bacterium SG7u.111]